MGWFLSKKKGRSSRTRATAKTTGRKPWNPQRTLAGLQFLAALGLIFALAVSFRHGEKYLSAYAREHHPARTGIGQVALVNTPAWMNSTLQKQLQDLVAAQINPDPLDSRSLDQAMRALVANPWVQQVQRVRRMPDGQIRVQATFRQPMALVEYREGYHLVDGQGVRLPGVYSRLQVTRLTLPIITGVTAGPSREGQPWAGQELQAGLALVRTLVDQPYAHQIQRFDVSERDARGRIRLNLHTRTGLVRWGFAPGQEQTIEPEASIKKQWLANVYKQRGSIDAGGQIVDVYGAAVFVHPKPEEQIDQQAGFTWPR